MKEEIVTTNYKVNTGKLNKPLRLALVTDFHECDPEPLLSLLRRENPDGILIAGDTFERHKEGKCGRTYSQIAEYQQVPLYWSIAKYVVKVINKCIYNLTGVRSLNHNRNRKNGYRLIREASQIAPIYLSPGNHEWYFLSEDYKIFSECKVTLLDNTDYISGIKGMEIDIGGLSTCYDLEWLDSFSEKEGVKILLCHHPEYYFRYMKGRRRDTFDLILCGHCHGGQWRVKLPGGLGERGIFAPSQGMLSKYVHGMWRTGNGHLIVSAGVSNPAVVPRFGNPCELVMIHMR